MQLTLIAVSGPSGKPLIRRALAEGYTLVIYVRNTQKLDNDLKNDGRVRTVQGTLTEQDSSLLVSAIQGSQAVICLLAPLAGFPTFVGGSNTPLFQTNAYETILNAMTAAGCKRFIATGTPSYVHPRDKFSLIVRLGVGFLWLIAPKVPADVIESQKVLERWKDRVEWVWPRVPLITNGTVKQGEVPTYKIGYLGDQWFMRISREGLAKALLDQVQRSEWVGKEPIIYQ